VLNRALSNLVWLIQVLKSAAVRFYWDDCFSRASALAYATLFALVPVLALSLSMFSLVGMTFEDLAATLRTVVEQVIPSVGSAQVKQLQNEVVAALEQFTMNVRALNVISTAVLFFTAVALLNTIESALNVIWRVSSNLSILTKVTSFWAILTLGPILLGVSIAWTTKVKLLGVADELGWFATMAEVYFVPVTVTWIGLALLFYKLPAAKVALKHALLGAFVAAVMFEFIKRGFGYYVGLSSTYSTMYGVLASIPLFLFWLYVTWAVVLLGAEISYQAGAIHVYRGIGRYATELGETGALLGLRILISIGKAFKEGRAPLTESEIAIDSGTDPVLVRTCLNVLSDSAIISRQDDEHHTRTLLISPEKITIGEIFQAFRSDKNRDNTGRVGDLLRIIVGISAVSSAKPVQEWSLDEVISFQ
jgi:membrane protein